MRQKAARRNAAAPGAASATPGIVRALAAALLVAGAWAYVPSFAGVLVLDDLGAISANPTIRSLWPLTGALTPPPATTLSGRPIANLSFAIDYAVSGGEVRGYHVTNLAVHLAAALTLFGVVRRTLLTPRLAPGFGAASTWLAFVVSLLWVLHPVHTQAVTYVVQRVESLMGLFYLVALYCAIRASDDRRRWWTAGAIATAALGMATKETMVTLPVIVWLWYRTIQTTSPRVVALLPATWLVLLPLVLSAPRGDAAGFGVAGWTPWTYLVTQTEVITHYLRLLVVPAPLVFHYAWPQVTSLADVVPEAALLAGLFAVTAVAVARRHPAGFAGVCFFAVLAPTSSIVPIVTEVAAEHRLYLPAAAVIALAVTGIFAAGSRWSGARARLVTAAGAAVTIAAAIALGAATYARNQDYGSTERLWRDTVAKQPASPRAQLGYGLALLGVRRFADAEPHLREAVSLEPINPLARRGLGVALSGAGRFGEAVPVLERAVALLPEDAVAWGALGEAYAGAGRLSDARAAVTRALSLNPAPDTAEALRDLLVRYSTGRR